MYLKASLLIGKIERASNRWRNEAPLRRTVLTTRLLFVTYTALLLSAIWRLYARGLYEWQDFTSNIFVKTFYFMMKVELFLLLVKWTPRLRLKT